MNLHQLAEERSLAYHGAVAERLRREPQLVDAARQRVAGWIAEGRSVEYARRWQEILHRPMPEILAFLVADSDRGRAMRQATPFAGFIDQTERLRIWREVGARFHGAA